ncbi:alpha/beta fold hydrolase [Aquiflexum sp.]|uniref:alpha/beta fold hydrolase n=1 Tax=Aquiflexum sp. TaxID=1872584 RepID=UPI003592FD9E
MNRVNFKVGKNIISCIEAGDRGKPLILFLHGIPPCAEIWHETMQKISGKGFYCLAPDLAGYGKTEISESNNYSLLGNAQLLNQWLKEQKFDKVWLVGHDLGGAIAQLMLTDKHSNFEKVTLSNAGTADTYPVPEISKLVKASKIGLFYWLAHFGSFKADDLYKEMNNLFFRNKPIPCTDFERVFYDGKFHQREAIVKFQKMLKRLNNRHTVENMSKLKNIDVPVHLIWAMSDQFQSWESSGRILEKSFSNVRVSKIENCGHFLQLDANEEFVDKLLN